MATTSVNKVQRELYDLLSCAVVSDYNEMHVHAVRIFETFAGMLETLLTLIKFNALFL